MADDRKMDEHRMADERAQRQADQKRADDRKSAESRKAYTARHRIIRTEAGARREYNAGQPISLTEDEAKNLISKKAVWASKQEFDEAAKAKVEGVAAPQSDLDYMSEGQRQAMTDEQMQNMTQDQRNQLRAGMTDEQRNAMLHGEAEKRRQPKPDKTIV